MIRIGRPNGNGGAKTVGGSEPGPQAQGRRCGVRSGRQPGEPQSFAKPFGILGSSQVRNVHNPFHVLARTSRRITTPAVPHPLDEEFGALLCLIDTAQMTAGRSTPCHVARVTSWCPPGKPFQMASGLTVSPKLKEDVG